MNLDIRLSRQLLSFYTRFSLYIIIGIVALLVLIGYTLLIGPKWTEISSVGLSDYKNEQARLDNDKEYLEALKSLVAKYNTINQTKIDDISKIVPTGDQLPALFVEMEAMATDAGMDLETVTFSTETNTAVATSTGGLKTLTISMNIKGGSRYSDMKQLIDTIEKNQRLLDLISISFTLDETDVVSVDETTGGAYTLSLRTYYLDEPAVASTPATQNPELDAILQNINAQP